MVHSGKKNIVTITLCLKCLKIIETNKISNLVMVPIFKIRVERKLVFNKITI
jgi:stalled ribosome alternative rescue factor ArfA